MSASPGIGSGFRLGKVLRLRCLLLGAIAALFLTAEIPTAKAVVCARGVYRAGCAGPHGAVVVRRPVHHHCYWRAGVRVCR
jgi:hypothetical protein